MLTERLPEIAAVWFASEDAVRAARSYRHAYLAQYQKAKAGGQDEGRLRHKRGNAQGRFYEHLIVRAMSTALSELPQMDYEFACTGGAASLGGALSRSKDGDIVVESPSFSRGPDNTRAEFDALAWEPTGGVVLAEVTASEKNIPELISDLWKKQEVAMRIFDLAQPPPVVLVSPHEMPQVRASVARFKTSIVPFPESLWDIAVAASKEASPSQPPPENVGPNLRLTKPLDFPGIVAKLAEAFICAMEAGTDARSFCSAHEGTLRMTRRIYLGELKASDAADMVTRVGSSEPLDPDLIERIRRGKAEVHVTLRRDSFKNSLFPVVHVLTGRRWKTSTEVRVVAGQKPESIKRPHQRLALRNEIPRHGRRELKGDLVLAAVRACARPRVAARPDETA